MTREQVKKIRTNLFMTQEKFAKEINVSQKTVSGWENGVVGISLRNQEKIFNLCKEKNIKWEE